MTLKEQSCNSSRRITQGLMHHVITEKQKVASAFCNFFFKIDLLRYSAKNMCWVSVLHISAVYYEMKWQNDYILDVYTKCTVITKCGSTGCLIDLWGPRTKGFFFFMGNDVTFQQIIIKAFVNLQTLKTGRTFLLFSHLLT